MGTVKNSIGQAENQNSIAEDVIENNPVALFYILEDARRNSDFEKAALAQKKLKQLGVIVEYRSHVRGRRQCRMKS